MRTSHRFGALGAVVLAAWLTAAGATPARLPDIVALVPSFTEDLFAIGAGSQVVGVSVFTDYPPAATQLPVVASFAAVDSERVAALQPDLVVGIPAQAAQLAELQRLGLRTELLPDDSYEQIFSDLIALGKLSGHAAAAQRLAANLRAQTSQLVARVHGRSRPRCLVVLGVAPTYTVGDRSYIAQLIALAGGRNAARLGTAYGHYSDEAVVAAQPDVIVTDRASGLNGVLGRPPWSLLRAVRAHRVYTIDNPDLLERPGPRYNQGLAWLIAHLQLAAANPHA